MFSITTTLPLLHTYCLVMLLITSARRIPQQLLSFAESFADDVCHYTQSVATLPFLSDSVMKGYLHHIWSCVGQYYKTLYFCCILISRFLNEEISLHFNLAFSQCSTSIYQAFDGQTEFSQVFNFVILSYSRNSQRLCFTL